MIGSRYYSLLKAGTIACGALDKIAMIYWLEFKLNLFGTGMDDHHNAADRFHMVSNSRQVGVWKYGLALCR